MNLERTTPRQTLIAVATFAVVGTATIYATRLAARQHEELVALQQRAAQL